MQKKNPPGNMHHSLCYSKRYVIAVGHWSCATQYNISKYSKTSHKILSNDYCISALMWMWTHPLALNIQKIKGWLIEACWDYPFCTWQPNKQTLHPFIKHFWCSLFSRRIQHHDKKNTQFYCSYKAALKQNLYNFFYVKCDFLKICFAFFSGRSDYACA